MSTRDFPIQQTRRERKKIEVRHALLAASKQLFEQKGYEKTHIEEIAEAADISRGTFFNYYPSKESVLWALFKEETHDLRSYLDIELGLVSSYIEKIYRLMAFWVADTLQLRDLIGNVVLSGFASQRHFNDDTMAIFQELLENACNQQELQPENKAEDLVLLLVGIYYSYVLHAPDKTDIKTAYSVVYQLLNNIFAGLNGPNFVQPTYIIA